MSGVKILQSERLNRGLSLRMAAEAIGVSLPVLSRAEAGGGLHPANKLKIAKFYGYEVTDIWPIREAAAA